MRLICQLLRTDMCRFLLNVFICDDILLLQKFLFIIINLPTFFNFFALWATFVFEWPRAVVLAVSIALLSLLRGEAHGPHVSRHAQEKETRKHVGNERAD